MHKTHLSFILTILTLITLFIIVTCPANFQQGDTPVSSTTNGVWLTTADETAKLERKADLNISYGSGTRSIKIEVDDSVSYQQMDGFGAALTDSSAWLVFNSSHKNTIMNALFSKIDGIGISFIRLPIGASDYSLTSYTYDDTSPDLNDFSIAHDQSYIIPILQQALTINPDIKIIATPWSAPAWMKLTGTLNGGSFDTTNCNSIYADYFVKFIEAYDAEGIDIYAVTPQNEPHYSTTDYPSMYMEWDEQAEFIKTHLYPKLIAATLDTNIIIWDHNRDKTWYPTNIYNELSSEACYSRIIGSAWHAYEATLEPSAQTTIHNAFPSKGIYFTERSGSGVWSFETNLQWSSINVFIDNIQNWAKTVMLWNMVLNENYGPDIRPSSDCRGLITMDQTNDTIANYEAEYYTLGHFSKFVNPGAYYIKSSNNDNSIESVAFKNTDGSKIVVVLNTGDSSKEFDINANSRYFSYTLPRKSIVTFKW